MIRAPEYTRGTIAGQWIAQLPVFICANTAPSHNYRRCERDFVRRGLCYRERMTLGEHVSRIASRVIVAAAVLLASALTAQAASRRHPRNAKERSEEAPLCQVNNLTVEMPREFLSLGVAGNSFIARENSAGVLTLRNGFSQRIQEIAVVLEYLDGHGKRIFTAAFAGTSNTLVSPSWFSERLPSQYSLTQWQNPVAAGATFSLGATSGITTAECPAQARATLLHVEFQGGKMLDWSAPDWQLPVQLREIPGDLELNAPADSLPETFLVRVRVAAPSGASIPKARIDLLKGRPGVFFDEIRNQMTDWRYWCALRDGKRVDGDETILIRVHTPRTGADQGVSPVLSAEIPQPLGIVDLVPQTAPGRWAVFYGGARIGDNPPAQAQP
ncbi:MAG TPA: hypothetical protein VNF02_02795 [Candidatus Limnocylindrales bacterium]|nr:hypothetical protein [Candidatus Limnocylindrales bacterium]